MDSESASGEDRLDRILLAQPSLMLGDALKAG
jgi:hypothetical protein